ncbi:MAG: hypothetical protein VW258_09360, partial [Thalassolituus sp.]
MTPEQWAESVVGLPYRDREDGPYAFDCFGLAMDYVRRVLGLKCDMTGYHTGVAFADLLACADGWQQCDNGMVLCAFVGDEPTHIGVKVGQYVIHSYGRDAGGQVFRHRFRAFERLFPDYKV